MGRVSWLTSLLVVVAVAAHAESWQAEMTKVETNSPKCPDVPLVYEVETVGTALKITMPNGQTHTSQVAADGSVKMTLPNPATTIDVTGNITSKDIRFAPRALKECFYVLKPLDAAAAQDFKSWKATYQQTQGPVTTCTSSGWRGRIETRGKALLAFGEVAGIRGPLFGVKLNDDGSADVDTKTAFGPSSTARVKVSPGGGARELTFTTYTNVCRYRVIPD
jgi:hypothetical protein